MNRYNEYGYWKPYSDIPDYLGFHKKIYSMNLPEDVKDVLFYCKHTNCCVIEFVVKTYLELPYPSTDFSIYTINMFKCEHIYEYCKTRQLCVYDCTFPLENDGIDTITKALNNISIEMNRLAFYYDAPLTWRLKYKDKERNPVSISPSDDFLKNNPIPAYLTNINQDRVYLNMAAEWYRIANISSDLFVAFSAYYFALETLIFAKTDCGANFNISVEYIKKDAETCFDSIIKSQKTKSEIIKELYFDCFGSNKDRVSLS